MKIETKEGLASIGRFRKKIAYLAHLSCIQGQKEVKTIQYKLGVKTTTSSTTTVFLGFDSIEINLVYCQAQPKPQLQLG